MREMLIEAVERRFGTVETVPAGQTLEFLSDNGGAYIVSVQPDHLTAGERRLQAGCQ